METKKVQLTTVGFTTIVGIFEHLNKASSIKMHILDISVEDTSDVLNYETWTVHLEDENGLRHTIKVEIAENDIEEEEEK